MKLGKQSRYAIEGLLVLAKRPFGTTMQLHDIADVGNMPENFLAKIFQKLTRAKLVTSSRGAVRGYALARRSRTINVKDVLLAVEGSDTFDRCVFWSDRCAEAAPCPMHIHWKRVRQNIAALMERTTVADLARHTHARIELNPSETHETPDIRFNFRKPDHGAVGASHL
jgi:Rrf2 family transcriptional regulator, iron-sulfur cluster assembly transcription factor